MLVLPGGQPYSDEYFNRAFGCSPGGVKPESVNHSHGSGPGCVPLTDEPIVRPRAGEPDLSEAREIKVKLPVSLHIKLHGLKITKHRAISDVVLEALEDYFARLEREGKKP